MIAAREDTMKINSREFTVKCYKDGCNTRVSLTVWEEGYITVEGGKIKVTTFTDGSHAADVYCDACKDGE
jgi:hypothetical protein